MLTENTKVILSDLRGRNDVGMEVCHSSNEDLVDTILVTVDGKEAIIPIKELYSFIFVVGNAQQQEAMMPVKQTTVRKIRKVHIVEATKDIRKGEKLKVRCETNVPVEVWEGMAGMMGQRPAKRKMIGNIPIIGAK